MDDLEIRHDMYGYYLLTAEEADWEDEGNNSAGFDGRQHYATMQAAGRARAAKYRESVS